MDGKLTEATILRASASVMAMGLVVLEDLRYMSFIPRVPRNNMKFERETYINSVIHDPKDALIKLRMRPYAFFELCKTLLERNLIKETIHMSVKEQLFIF